MPAILYLEHEIEKNKIKLKFVSKNDQISKESSHSSKLFKLQTKTPS